MKILHIITWVLLCLVVMFASCLVFFPAKAQITAPKILILTVDSAISAPLADYIERGIRYAQQHDNQLIILQLNTPGGSVEITNRIVQMIRSSSIPFVVYVAPRGAMAGSGGTVITLAGHAAGMAPETAIGAASPVGMQGEDMSTTLQRKSKEILRATVRSLAEHRNPQAIALAEATIENAKAVSATEALQAGLVDFIAVDINDLLRQLDGYSIQVSSEQRVLHLAGADIQDLPNTWIERILLLLTNPNIVFLLLAIGVQAIFIELSSPGGWFAGFIGVAALSLAIYGLGLLPVNWFGLIFVGAAFVLFILELKAAAHGALTVVGAISFVIGALVLFNSADTPDFQQVSLPLVIATALIIAGTFAFGVGFALRAQSVPIQMGKEFLVGQTGIVRVALDPRGQVQVAGELWSAENVDGERAIPVGARVEVIGMNGIYVRVRSIPLSDKV